jgi:hypothetical protein
MVFPFRCLSGYQRKDAFSAPGISISYNLIENWFNNGKFGKLSDIIDSENAW